MTCSAASVSRRTGASAAREIASPTAAAMPIPASATAMRNKRIRSSASSISVNGRATWTAYPGSYATVSTRTCVPATSVSEVADCLAGLGRRARAPRPRPAARPSRDGCAGYSVGFHELDQRVRLPEARPDGEERLAGLGLDLGDRDAEDLLRPLLERVVDLRAQLAADDEVHEGRNRARRQARLHLQRRLRSEPGTSLAKGVADAANGVDETASVARFGLSP